MSDKVHFGFSKLLVADLEKAAAFYSEVFGLAEMVRVDSDIMGRPISEIMYFPTAEGAATFVLLAFQDVQTPSNNEVIIGFQTPDLDATLKNVESAGGKVVDPIRVMPEHGIKVAFATDLEGHLIEIVELLPGAHS